MALQEFQAWFDSFVLRALAKLIDQGVEVTYDQVYIALAETLSVEQAMEIMEQEQQAA